MDFYYVYHVVTEKPLFVGQKIKFNENSQSGVYKRVMEHKKIVEDIYANPNNYDINKLEHHTKVALRELAMEKVRLKKYSSLPSRLSSLYVSTNIEDAINWANYFISLGRNVYQIVLLKVDGNRFTGDAHNCFDGTLDELENLKLAEHYWKNEKNIKGQEPLLETLVNGDIEVVEIIKDYQKELNKNKQK